MLTRTNPRWQHPKYKKHTIMCINHIWGCNMSFRNSKGVYNYTWIWKLLDIDIFNLNLKYGTIFVLFCGDLSGPYEGFRVKNFHQYDQSTKWQDLKTLTIVIYIWTKPWTIYIFYYMVFHMQTTMWRCTSFAM